jgi:hypothetical protein
VTYKKLRRNITGKVVDDHIPFAPIDINRYQSIHWRMQVLNAPMIGLEVQNKVVTGSEIQVNRGFSIHPLTKERMTKRRDGQQA